MPIIQCDIREGRGPQQKGALAEAITKAVHDTIGSPVEWINVLIRETPGSHHWHGGHALPEYAADG